MDKKDKKTLRTSKSKTIVNPSKKRYESVEEKEDKKSVTKSDLIASLLLENN